MADAHLIADDASSIVRYDGNNQDIKDTTYYKLEFNSGTKTLLGDCEAKNELSIQNSSCPDIIFFL